MRTHPIRELDPERQGASRSHVLVVDDDADVRVDLKAILEAEGFVATVEESGEEAIGAVERTAFDAIVLDKELPDINGLDLVCFFKHRCPDVPIVMITEAAGPLARQLGRHRGARACLAKPVHARTLVELLHGLVGRRRSRTKSEQVGGTAHPVPAPVRLAPGSLWAVVLAGPRGSGAAEPAVVRHAVDRLVTRLPLNRTIVVGLRRHADEMASAFAGAPAPQVLIQPRDLGTAAEALLPVYWIQRLDPGASVVVVAPDVVLRAEAAFQVSGWLHQAIETLEFVDRYPRWLVLLGTETGDATWNGGWILPGAVLSCSARGPVWRVHRIAGKPFPETARKWIACGALANTGLIIAKVAVLVETTRILVPSLHQRLLRVVPFLGTATEIVALRRAYRDGPRFGLFQTILEPSIPILAVGRITVPTAAAESPPTVTEGSAA